MTKQELFEKLKEFLVEHFEIDANNISLESNFYTDLDLDSIDAIDLILNVIIVSLHDHVFDQDFIVGHHLQCL